MTDPNVPTDQHLNVEAMQAMTIQENDDPPELELIIDVEHADTGHVWRQSLRLTKAKWVELMQLLDYIADTQGVKWR